MAWFSGETEGADRCAIVVSKRDADKGAVWSKPVVASVETGRSAQNPVLYVWQGELHLLHTSQRAGPLGDSQRYSRVQRVCMQSEDGGWEEPTIIMPEGRGAFIRGPILESGEFCLGDRSGFKQFKIR